MNDLSYADMKRLRDLAKLFEKKEAKPGQMQQVSFHVGEISPGDIDQLVLKYSYDEVAVLTRAAGVTPKGRKKSMIAVLLQKGII